MKSTCLKILYPISLRETAQFKNQYETAPFKYQRGNALFLILIAVALFAALSYAITQSGRGSGSIERENILIATAQVSQYAGQLQSAIQRMQLAGAFPTPEHLSLQNSVDSAYNNATCTTDDCRVFAAAGGGVTWQTPPTALGSATAYIITAHNRINGVGSTASTGYVTDMILLLPGLSEAACRAFNRATGLGTTIPVESDGTISQNKYSSTWATGGGTMFSTTGGALDGKMEGCFELTSGNRDYYYYSVIKPQ